MSQKGADYLTGLMSQALPQLLESLVLPTIEVPNFTGKNFVITKFQQPEVKAKFVDGVGVSVTILAPSIEVEGDCLIDMFFTAESHMEAKVKNWTIEMDVSIERPIGADRNNINVSFLTAQDDIFSLN